MTDPSRKSSHQTSMDIPSATSSVASESGPTPSVSPDGPMTDLFGLAVAPASPSASQEKVKLMKTIDTLRRRGYGSLESADLQSSLENRLAQRLEWAGSMLFSLKWSKCSTPAGRLISRLAASGRRTSDKGCTSWPTPMAGTPAQTWLLHRLAEFSVCLRITCWQMSRQQFHFP